MADASTCETCGRPVLDPKGCDYDRLIIHGPACICADCRHWCRAPRLPCLPVDWHYRAIAAEARAEAAEAERDALREAVRFVALHGTTRPLAMGVGDDGDGHFRRIAFDMIGHCARALDDGKAGGA